MSFKQVAVFSILLMVSMAASVSEARFNPPPKQELLDWSTVLKNSGVKISFADFAQLQGLEAFGSTEHHLLSVDLVMLARSYPRRADEWVRGAASLLSESAAKAQKNDSFRLTRTEFLEATLTGMLAEGPKAKVFSAARMVSAFNRYAGSPGAFYKITSIFRTYTDLVSSGRFPAGEKTLKEAAIEYKVASYKEKMDVGDLPYESDTVIRARLEKKARRGNSQARNVASLRNR